VGPHRSGIALQEALLLNLPVPPVARKDKPCHFPQSHFWNGLVLSQFSSTGPSHPVSKPMSSPLLLAIPWARPALPCAAALPRTLPAQVRSYYWPTTAPAATLHGDGPQFGSEPRSPSGKARLAKPYRRFKSAPRLQILWPPKSNLRQKDSV